MKVFVVIEDQVYDYGAYDHSIIIHGVFTKQEDANKVKNEKAKCAYLGPASVYIETHMVTQSSK